MNDRPRTDWTSNASLEDVALRLSAGKRVAVLTHAKPDGDAAGSVLALVRALRRRGADALAVFPGPWFARFDAFVGDTPALRLPEGPHAADVLAREAGQIDTVAIVDTGSWSQVADVRAWLEPRTADAVCVDHHPAGDGAIAALRHIDTRAAAAAEIVAWLVVRLLDLPSPARLPAEVAEPLFLGAATDTGWFRYSNTTPATLRLAADLVEAGADHNRVYAISEQSDRAARLRILARALGSLEMTSGDLVATMSLTQRDFSETGATLEDAGRLYDLAQSVASVRVVAVLTEIDAANTKVSFRSKPAIKGEPGAEWFVDVNRIAGAFGGGGHVHAAGAKVALPIAEARRSVVREIERALPARSGGARP